MAHALSSQFTLTRRRFVVGSVLAPWPFSALSLEPPQSTLLRRVVRAPTDTYFTYPHSNGFLPDGRAVLASPAIPGAIDYIAFDLSSGKAERINRMRSATMYYAVSRTGLIAVPRRYGLSVFDGTTKDSATHDLTHHPGWAHRVDCDISADGRRALISRRHATDRGPESNRVDMIDLRSGEWKTIMRSDCKLDHAHFSPFNPEWVCIACDDPARLQRLWVWHPTQAPAGRPLFRQRVSKGRTFDVGHERAMFNKPAMLVVAYGVSSTARPCGLYEVRFDGKVRLVSESNRDFHCNVSPDGRWAVVSLQGTQDLRMEPIRSEWRMPQVGFGPSDVQVVDMQTGRRAFLWRGTNSAQAQPYEVQPSISPDGEWVLLKDAREKTVLALQVDKRKLNAFLTKG